MALDIDSDVNHDASDEVSCGIEKIPIAAAMKQRDSIERWYDVVNVMMLLF